MGHAAAIGGQGPAERLPSRIDSLVSHPREDLSAEYKCWLDLRKNEHKANLAKAAIALANHGGGFIVLGFLEDGANLRSQPCPPQLEIKQDAVNSAIIRFADPEFHCEVHYVENKQNGVKHPVVTVPGSKVPVMAKRGCDGAIRKHRCYIRKPGPRSEEPQSGAEWRHLIDRCVRENRSDMLDSIRAIVLGTSEPPAPSPDAFAELFSFCDESRKRWEELVKPLPEGAAARFPHGYYEMAFSPIGAVPAGNLTELRNRLAEAHRTKLTGWVPFLDWEQRPYGQSIESWPGGDSRVTDDDPSVCDYWRATPDGNLYTIRGYTEDGLLHYSDGSVIDVTLPVWRVAESVLFAGRLAETFAGVSSIAVRCRFSGLNGRKLTSIDRRRPSVIFTSRTSMTDSFEENTIIPASQVRDNIVEIAHRLLAGMYELFDFFELQEDFVKEEIGEMLKRQ